MSIDYESIINFITIFFDRCGLWFLTGEALANFVSNGSISACKTIEIGMIDATKEDVFQRLMSFGVNANKNSDDAIEFNREGVKIIVLFYSRQSKGKVYCNFNKTTLNYSWIRCDDEELLHKMRQKRIELNGNGFWRRQLSEENPQYLRLPFMYGTVLDAILPKWYLNITKMQYPTRGEIFFDAGRKKNGYILASKLYECAEKAGFGDKIFHGFGTMLGYLMYGDFIPKDRDADACILSDDITAEQTKTYGELAYRIDGTKPPRWETSERPDTKKYVWFSVGYKNPMYENGTKSCNWFFYSWDGYWFHTKGGLWVNPRKMNQEKIQYDMTDEAIGLGIPVGLIDNLVEVPFGPIKIKIPEKAGSCADHWYPGWSPRGDGASAHKIVQVVGTWDDEKTWRLV